MSCIIHIRKQHVERKTLKKTETFLTFLLNKILDPLLKYPKNKEMIQEQVKFFM